MIAATSQTYGGVIFSVVWSNLESATRERRRRHSHVAIVKPTKGVELTSVSFSESGRSSKGMQSGNDQPKYSCLR